MKKLFVLLSLACLSFGYSQEKEKPDFKQNELKGNALFLVMGFPEFTYERILNDESGVGITVGFALDKDFETKFTLSPYYRFYLGKKPAAGFFVEGFGMLNSLKIDDYTYYESDYSTGATYYTYKKGKSYTDVAVGFGVGSKWVTKKGFLFEISAGLGRNLINSDTNDYFDHTFVGKGGLTVGYRF